MQKQKQNSGRRWAVTRTGEMNFFFLISPIYFLIHFFFNLTDLSARWAVTQSGEIKKKWD